MTHEEISETAVSSEKEIKKISVKKIGAVLSIGVCSVIAVGAMAILSVGNRTPEIESTSQAQAAQEVAVTTTTVAQGDYPGTMSWWKAGVAAYNFNAAQVKEGTTTTVATTTVQTTTTKETKETTTAKTTAAKKETTTTKAVTTTAKKISYTEYEEAVTMYATVDVNLRKNAGTEYDKIKLISDGTKVSVLGKTDNGWYKVKASDKTGYISEDYLTEKAPETVTTTAKKTEAKAEKTEAKAAKTEETKKVSSSDEPVISYSDEEYQMLLYVVEGEVGGCSKESKLAVANVIINRVQNSRFPSTLKGVLTAKNQFTAINNYYDKYRTPTKTTIECVDRALAGEDNSKGALYFYSPTYCSGSTAAWFESLTFCLEVDGQRYFK